MKREKDNYSFLDFNLLKSALQEEIFRIIDASLYTMLDFAPVSFYWKDLQGRYMGCNHYMLELAQFADRADIIGKTDRECSWSGSYDELWEVDQQVMQLGVCIQLEEQVIINNQQRIYLTRKSPLYTVDQEIMGLVGVSFDITAQRQAQQQEIEEKLKRLLAERKSQEEKQYRMAVTTHSGGMAHDLKNPLHANGLSLEMLQYELEKLIAKHSIASGDLEKIYQYVQQIHTNNNRMTEMIDLSNRMIQNISSDTPGLVVQKIDAYQLLLGSLSNYEKEWEEGLIVLDVRDHMLIDVDRIAFYRVMINLIENAKRQIALRCKGKIYISAFLDQDKYVIEVKDTAGGVTQQLVNQLFTLYRNRQVQGTGIGLQACQELLRLMNANLSAHLVDKDCIALRVSFYLF